MLNYNFIERLKAQPFVDKILLYGSRARGDARERSDIDIAIVCPQATDEQWLVVLDIIDNADTLLKIDCVRYEDVANQALLDAINSEHVTLFERQRC